MTNPFSFSFGEGPGDEPAPFERRKRPGPTYEEIFEQDGRWLLGRHVLADIVNFARGKTLEVKGNGSMLELSIPLPYVRNAVNGDIVDVIRALPPEMAAILIDRLHNALSDYLGEDGKRMLNGHLYSANTTVLVQRVQNELWRMERSRQDRGEGELWQVIAQNVGLPTFPISSPPAFEYATPKAG